MLLNLFFRYTEHSTVGLAQQWDQLDQLGMRMQHNLEQQIQARQDKLYLPLHIQLYFYMSVVYLKFNRYWIEKISFSNKMNVIYIYLGSTIIQNQHKKGIQLSPSLALDVKTDNLTIEVELIL